MRITPCKECKGQRLKKEALAVTVGEKNIYEVTNLSIENLKKFMEELKLTPQQELIGKQILKEIRQRVGFLSEVGLDYLSLGRATATLSGGELARLRFAELALERPNLMFLDEPTNHLDIFMRESLTKALDAYTGTLLLVTHDRYLMQTLGCPILYLENGKAVFYPDFNALNNRANGHTS